MPSTFTILEDGEAEWDGEFDGPNPAEVPGDNENCFLYG